MGQSVLLLYVAFSVVLGNSQKTKFRTARGASPNRPANRIPSTQEDNSTVRELEKGWAACLHSLCGRLKVTAPVRGQRVEPACLASMDDGRSRGRRKCERGSEDIVADCREEPCPIQLELAGEDPVKRLECYKMAVGADKTGEDTLRPMNTGDAAPATILRPEKVDCPSPIDDAEHEASRLQAVRYGLPALSIDKKDTQGGFWFDKALVRVGGRVPWGRRHRGRFAKVKVLISGEPYLREFHGWKCVCNEHVCRRRTHIPNLQKEIADKTIREEESATGGIVCPAS